MLIKTKKTTDFADRNLNITSIDPPHETSNDWKNKLIPILPRVFQYITWSPSSSLLAPHLPLPSCQAHSVSLTTGLVSGPHSSVMRHEFRGTVSPKSCPPTQPWGIKGSCRIFVPAVNPDSFCARARDAILSPPALFLLVEPEAVRWAPASSVRKPRLCDGRLYTCRPRKSCGSGLKLPGGSGGRDSNCTSMNLSPARPCKQSASIQLSEAPKTSAWWHEVGELPAGFSSLLLLISVGVLLLQLRAPHSSALVQVTCVRTSTTLPPCLCRRSKREWSHGTGPRMLSSAWLHRSRETVKPRACRDEPSWHSRPGRSCSFSSGGYSRTTWPPPTAPGTEKNWLDLSQKFNYK